MKQVNENRKSAKVVGGEIDYGSHGQLEAERDSGGQQED
jgi:hypothetical protein